jgi:hypothetical protein
VIFPVQFRRTTPNPVGPGLPFEAPSKFILTKPGGGHFQVEGRRDSSGFHDGMQFFFLKPIVLVYIATNNRGKYSILVETKTFHLCFSTNIRLYSDEKSWKI